MMFDTKVSKLAEKTQGVLIIKEYPTASAHSGHFRSLLNELLTKSFRPDIIFIDYLNIYLSSRYSKMGNVNSYSYIKALQKNLEDWRLKQTSLSFLRTRPLVLVMVGF